MRFRAAKALEVDALRSAVVKASVWKFRLGACMNIVEGKYRGGESLGSSASWTGRHGGFDLFNRQTCSIAGLFTV